MPTPYEIEHNETVNIWDHLDDEREDYASLFRDYGSATGDTGFDYVSISARRL